MAMITPSMFLRTSTTAIRSVSKPCFNTQASRISSRAGRSARSCASPSTSIANRARTQTKSSAYGPIGCCLRKRYPPGRCCNCCQSSTSGNNISLRNARAILTVASGAPIVRCLIRTKSSPERGGGAKRRRGRSTRIALSRFCTQPHPTPPPPAGRGGRSPSPVRGGMKGWR